MDLLDRYLASFSSAAAVYAHARRLSHEHVTTQSTGYSWPSLGLIRTIMWASTPERPVATIIATTATAREVSEYTCSRKIQAYSRFAQSAVAIAASSPRVRIDPMNKPTIHVPRYGRACDGSEAMKSLNDRKFQTFAWKPRMDKR